MTPEMALLLRCSRSRLDPAILAAVERDLSGDLDWTHFVQLTMWHGVPPLVARSVQQVGGTGRVPPDILAAFASYSQSTLKRNLALVGELATVADALGERGVIPVSFKGPTLALSGYGDLALRTGRDLDFLIDAREYPVVHEVLESLGYIDEGFRSPTERAACWRIDGQAFLVKPGGIAVEPHWSLVPRALATAIDHAGIRERARPLDLEHGRILTPAPEDMLIILCIHGSKDQWTRLTLICDVAEFLGQHPEIEWNVVLERARSQRCRRVLFLGLALARRLLRASLPDHIIDRLDSEPSVTRLADRAELAVAHECHPAPSIASVSRFRYSTRDTRRDRVLYVLRTLTTPRKAHFRIVPLPARMRWAYRPIKVLHDYVALPLWLAGKRAHNALRSSGEPSRS